jgi:septation ring formation regulator EzrA
MPPSDYAELSSLRAQVDELAERVVAVGDRYRDSDDSAIAAELDQAERLLVNARRSIDRAATLLE